MATVGMLSKTSNYKYPHLCLVGIWKHMPTYNVKPRHDPHREVNLQLRAPILPAIASPLLQPPGLQDRVKVEYRGNSLLVQCAMVLTIDFGVSPHASKLL